MHRAPPPAPAPQPACAIARPPARSLPRAISRFQGRRTFPSSRRAATGPGSRMQNTGHAPPRTPVAAAVVLILVPGALEPGRPRLNDAPRSPAPGRADARPARPSAWGGRDDVTTPRSAPGPACRSGRRYSAEKPPPVPRKNSVHLRLEAGVGRSPRPEEERARPAGWKVRCGSRRAEGSGFRGPPARSGAQALRRARSPRLRRAPHRPEALPVRGPRAQPTALEPPPEGSSGGCYWRRAEKADPEAPGGTGLQGGRPAVLRGARPLGPSAPPHPQNQPRPPVG